MDIWDSLQVGVFSYLTTHPEFAPLGIPYYVVQVPDSATYPYVSTPGDATSAPWYTMAESRGEEFLWSFHIWNDLDHGGPQRMSTIADALMAAMDDAEFPVLGYNLLMFRRVFSTPPMRQEGDPKLFQRVIRYRVILEVQP